MRTRWQRGVERVLSLAAGGTQPSQDCLKARRHVRRDLSPEQQCLLGDGFVLLTLSHASSSQHTCPSLCSVLLPSTSTASQIHHTGSQCPWNLMYFLFLHLNATWQIWPSSNPRISGKPLLREQVHCFLPGNANTAPGPHCSFPRSTYHLTL